MNNSQPRPRWFAGRRLWVAGTAASLTMVVVAALMSAGTLLVGGRAHASSTSAVSTYSDVTMGTLVPAAGPAAAPNVGPIHLSSAERQALATTYVAYPNTNTTQVAAAGPRVLSPQLIIDSPQIQFDGLYGSLNTQVNPLGDVEPPNVTLCVNGTFELEMIDDVAGVFNRSGGQAAAPMGLGAFFNEPIVTMQFIKGAPHPILAVPSAPRCYYEVTTGAWFASVSVRGLDMITGTWYGRTHLDLAVNRTADPRTPWKVYHINSTNDGSDGTPVDAGCPCVGVEPLLGVDGAAVYLSTNEFTLAGAFTGDHIYAVDKQALLAASSNIHVAQFENLTLVGVPVASIYPALTLTNPGVEYFLSSFTQTASSSQLGVWAMTNEAALSSGAAPTLSATVINTESYSQPSSAGAPQKGSTDMLDMGDDHMRQVEYRPNPLGQLYGIVATAVKPTGDTTVRAGAAYFDLAPSLSGGHISTVTIKSQGYVDQQGVYLIHPSMGIAPDGDEAVAGTLTGTGYYPTTVYTTQHLDAGSPFGPFQITGMGMRPEAGYTCAGHPCRWGDYAVNAWDPPNTTGEGLMWMAAEFSPSGPADSSVNYGTHLYAVGPI